MNGWRLYLLVFGIFVFAFAMGVSAPRPWRWQRITFAHEDSHYSLWMRCEDGRMTLAPDAVIYDEMEFSTQ